MADGFNFRRLLQSRALFEEAASLDLSGFDPAAIRKVSERAAGLSRYLEAVHRRLQEEVAPRVRTVQGHLDSLNRTLTS